MVYMSQQWRRLFRIRIKETICVFHRALLQKRHMILRSLLIVATPTAMAALFRIVQDPCPDLPKDMSAPLQDFLRQVWVISNTMRKSFFLCKCHTCEWETLAPFKDMSAPLQDFLRQVWVISNTMRKSFFFCKCHTCEWETLAPFKDMSAPLQESLRQVWICHMWEWVMSHVGMCHITHMDESWHTHVNESWRMSAPLQDFLRQIWGGYD